MTPSDSESKAPTQSGQPPSSESNADAPSADEPAGGDTETTSTPRKAGTKPSASKDGPNSCEEEEPLEDDDSDSETERARLEAEVAKAMHRYWSRSPVLIEVIRGWATYKSSELKNDSRANAFNARIALRSNARGTCAFLIAMVLGLSAVLLAIYLLKDDRDTLLPVLSTLVGLLAGTGGGYVFGRSQGRTTV